MNATYKRDLNGHYLILHSSGDLPDNHEMRTITSNRIPGLLPMEADSLNGETSCRYDISSLLPFSLLFRVIPPSEEVIRDLYLKLLDSLELFEDYLLNADHLLLDPEFLYTPRDEPALRMAYVPFYRKDLREQLIALTESILPDVGKAEDFCAVLLIRILGELKNETSGLSELRMILEQYSSGSSVRAAKGTSQNSGSASKNSSSYIVYSPDLQGEIPIDGHASKKSRAGSGVSYSGDTRSDPRDGSGFGEPVFPADPDTHAQSSGRHTGNLSGKKRRDILRKQMPEPSTWRTAAIFAVPAAALFALLRLQDLFYLSGTTSCGITLLGASLTAFGFRLAGHPADADTDSGTAYNQSAVPGVHHPYGEDSACASSVDRSAETDHRFLPSADTPDADLYAAGPFASGSLPADAHGSRSSAASPYSASSGTEMSAPSAGGHLISHGPAGYGSMPSCTCPQGMSSGSPPAPAPGGSAVPETSVLSGGPSLPFAASLHPEDPGSGLPVIPLDRPVIRIGKISGPSSAVLADETVSRIHAEIRCMDGQFYLIDLNSRNGTTAGGKLLSAEEKYLLTDGVSIAFSRCRYIFRSGSGN